MESVDLEVPGIFRLMVIEWRKCSFIFASSILFMIMLAYLNPRHEGAILYEVGKVFINNEIMPVEERSRVFERLASPNFLIEVEKKAGIPGLAKKLLSKDLGGEGKLTFVEGRSPSSIEIRVSAPSKIMATKELNALVNVLMNKHQSLIEPAFQENIRNLKSLISQYEELKNQERLELNSNVSNGDQNHLLYLSLIETRKQLQLAQFAILYPNHTASSSEGGIFFIDNQIIRIFRYSVFGLVIGFLLVLIFLRNKNKQV